MSAMDDLNANDFEPPEPIKCYTGDDTEPIEHQPHPEDTQWAKFPTIELDSDAVFFFAHSERDEPHTRVTGGVVAFEASEDVDVVTVSTNVGYHHHIYAKLCTFKREDGALGVGVISPKHEHDHDRDHEPHHPHSPHGHRRRPNIIELVVTFPVAKGSSNLSKFKSLSTWLPLYRHTIGDIGDKVEFDSVVLRGSNSPITSESLTASVTDVRTSNAPIQGSFNGTNSLTIRTVNAPIGVQVAFTSTLAADKEPAKLELFTANARLHASIELVAAGDAGTGSFDVVTHTVNAPLDVKFASAPVNSKLTYYGSTKNAPANVVLHPTYEGTLAAHTQLLTANLNAREDVEDPAGRDRARTISVHSVGRNGFDGEVYWGEKGDDTPAGSVKVFNTIGKIQLTV